MTFVHLTASRFFGGPERQMLGLAGRLRAATCYPEATAESGRTTPAGNNGSIETVFLSFAEEGLCGDFLEHARQEGFEARALQHDFPHLLAAARELYGVLRELGAGVLLCHGYKANFVGLMAARRMGIPSLAVSRGWTRQTRRVRLYEVLDRRVLRWMDHVVCVSEGQAEKVRRAGVPGAKISVIHNAIDPQRFDRPEAEYRPRLEAMFARRPRLIVGAAGRLSPEKGFGLLIEAAARVLAGREDVGFVLFGEGHLREQIGEQIERRGLAGRFVLAGFRPELDDFMPHFDILVVPSYSEGLSNVILEASAAQVPVVATAVGGNPEAVADGKTGALVPPGDSAALAEAIERLVAQPDLRRTMGRAGREYVAARFSFAAQAREYRRLLAELTDNRVTRPEADGWEACPGASDRC